MSNKFEYLSDEELEKLISETEQNAMIQAPKDLSENVMASIKAWETRKTISFTRYCIRVGFAVAAAIALVCVVPLTHNEGNYIPSKEYVLSERDYFQRRELTEKKPVRSKEEVLNDAANERSYLEETQDFIRTQINGLFK